MIVRDLVAEDWPAVRAIYEEGIRSGDATFETQAPSWHDWNAARPRLRLVAERDGSVVGWAAVSPASSRRCYRGVGEASVYVAETAAARASAARCSSGSSSAPRTRAIGR